MPQANMPVPPVRRGVTRRVIPVQKCAPTAHQAALLSMPVARCAQHAITLAQQDMNMLAAVVQAKEYVISADLGLQKALRAL